MKKLVLMALTATMMTSLKAQADAVVTYIGWKTLAHVQVENYSNKTFENGELQIKMAGYKDTSHDHAYSMTGVRVVVRKGLGLDQQYLFATSADVGSGASLGFLCQQITHLPVATVGRVSRAAHATYISGIGASTNGRLTVYLNQGPARLIKEILCAKSLVRFYSQG